MRQFPETVINLFSSPLNKRVVMSYETNKYPVQKILLKY